MVPPTAHTNAGAAARAQRGWRPWTVQAAAWATATAIVLLWGAAAQADPNAEFLAALREAGWNDTASEFVDWVADSPLVTEEFRDQLAYERAVSLAAEGRAARNRDERRQKMAEAAATFQGFAEADAGSDAALGAMRQAANLYAELALAELADAEQGNDASRRTARGLFEQATAAAEQLRDVCAARLAKLPKPAVIQTDPEAMAQRDQLRSRLAEAGLLIALVRFENARTYEAGSDGHGDALNQASDQFGELVEEYSVRTLVGASSRFYQGRCAQELGEHAKALGCFEDLIDVPATETEFRRWMARAHRRRAESLLALNKVDDAVRGCKQWLDESQPAELQEREWLEVAYQLALAYQKQLEKAPEGRSGARQTEERVRTLLQMVATRPNDFQRDARLALASGGRQGAGGQFENFGDALAGGKTALELMNSSLMAAKVAQQNNPDAVQELNDEAAASKQDAQAAFERAIELADEDAPIAEVNAVRYYLAWLYWEAGRTEEAAVLGEFVAARYPDGEFGPGAAKIALAAWERMYNEGGSEFPARKLVEVAQLIASQWPDAPEAASAISILINVALRENRIEQAEELLAKLPEGSRAGAELSLGSALWTQYLARTQKSDAAFDPEAAALRDKAEQLLTRGFAVVRDRGLVSQTGAVGALYLVQLLLSRGDASEALEVLEHKTVGPLTLVNSGAEAASQPKFVLETFKAALRAYLSVDPPRREDAQTMMDELDGIAARQGGNAADQLTSVYVGLGVQLQQQIKELTAAGQHMQAQQVAAAFGDVLDRVAKRPDAGDLAIRRWIAQTNLQIGLGLEGAEARKYLERARTAFETLLAAAEAGAAGAPSGDALLSLHKQLGDCLVGLGEFKAGIEEYAKVLRTSKEAAKMLDVQLAAAAAYQDWGATEKLEDPLNQSIHGAMVQRGGQNLIWGWLRISNAADGARRRAAATADKDPKAAETKRRFDELFFEARYNIAKSRFLSAQVVKPADRKTYLTEASKNVKSMRAQFPELGGPKWKAAFDELLAQIEEALKKA